MTLEFLSDGWVDSAADCEWLREKAQELRDHDWNTWTCCPLCAEVVCDDNCPLYDVRDELGHWIGSKGHP